MKRAAYLSLCLSSAVFAMGALFAACGKATNGSCEENDDCAEAVDGTAPASQADGSLTPDGADDATMLREDANGESDAPASDDAGKATIDAAVCPPDQKLCNGQCVAIDNPAFGCTPAGCSACTVENATAACALGACSVGTCDPGYAHCTTTGVACETSITTTSACGSCSVSCDAGLLCAEEEAGTAACTLTCPASAPTNCSGTCADLTSSNQHCGACTTACTNPSNGASNCVNKACVVSCDTGFHVCNGACFSNADLPTQDPCEISETYGVFVSASLGNDTNAGTRTAPLKSLHAGIAAAASAGKRVYACAEAYSEADTLVSGASLFGYFTCTGGTWAVGSGHAVVTSPTSPALTATNVTSARLESVEWDAPSQAAGSGLSSLGLLAANSTLTLVNVNLVAGNAGSGANGANASIPAATPSCAVAGTGTPASPAQNGTPSTATRWSASGFAPGVGGNGTPGANGANGTLTPQCINAPTGCASGTTYPACDETTTQVCAPTAGTWGCGGAGGAGGAGGRGGGSTVALVAWGSVISVTGGELAVATGGAGGSGGEGGSGASGTTGTTSGTVTYNSNACAHGSGTVCTERLPRSPLTTGCCYDDTIEGETYASVGGAGGAGAAGGYGAGGNGGDSYTYYVGGGASVTLDPTVNVATRSNSGAAGSGEPAGTAGFGGEYNTAD